MKFFNVVKMLCVCGSCLFFGLLQGNCWGMITSKSMKLIVSDDISQDQVRSFDSVTPKEKSEVFHRVSVDKFLGMNESNAQQYDDIELRHVKINRKFADKFWELFINGVSNLLFDSCTLLDGCKFTDILDGDYQVVCLSVVNCNITLDDVADILCLLYPYSIRRLNFQNNGLLGDAVYSLMTKILGSFAKSIEYFV